MAVNYTEPFHCVYLIKEPEPSRFYKIGRSSNFIRRLLDLNNARPSTVTVVDVLLVPSVDIAKVAEKWLHYLLRRHRKVREWFDLPNVEAWREAVHALPLMFNVSHLPLDQEWMNNPTSKQFAPLRRRRNEPSRAEAKERRLARERGLPLPPCHPRKLEATGEDTEHAHGLSDRYVSIEEMVRLYKLRPLAVIPSSKLQKYRNLRVGVVR